MVIAKVTSSKDNDQFYTVEKQDKKWSCSCPAFVFRKGQCKHILATKDALNGTNNPSVNLWVDHI